MLFKAVVMGFAVIHKTFNKAEYSLNFQELINELSGMRHPNFLYEGSVNTGEDECEKRGVKSPIATSLPYTRDYIGINQRYRKRLIKRGYSNTNSLVWPTVVLLFDQNRRLTGMIVVPDRNWSSVRAEFYKNLSFFLDPLNYLAEYNHKKGAKLLQPPNNQIIEIDFSNWRREWQYELGKNGLK